MDSALAKKWNIKIMIIWVQNKNYNYLSYPKSRLFKLVYFYLFLVVVRIRRLKAKIETHCLTSIPFSTHSPNWISSFQPSHGFFKSQLKLRPRPPPPRRRAPSSAKKEQSPNPHFLFLNHRTSNYHRRDNRLRRAEDQFADP